MHAISDRLMAGLRYRVGGAARQAGGGGDNALGDTGLGGHHGPDDARWQVAVRQGRGQDRTDAAGDDRAQDRGGEGPADIEASLLDAGGDAGRGRAGLSRPGPENRR